MKCFRLRCLCLSDGKYFEMVLTLINETTIDRDCLFTGQEQLRKGR